MTSPSVSVASVGQERETVVVIDDFAPDPHSLRQQAAKAAFARDELHYPGVKSPAPAHYFEAVQPIIASVMRELFGFRQGASVLRATYSLVTTPPDLLSVEQRLPHVDALEPGRMAILHYLALDDDDGTSFYRHRSTQFETLTAERSGAYFDSLNADLAEHGPPPAAYINGDSAIFERTAHFEGRFNRALIYRGRLLHSGAIRADRELFSDPAIGRLTVTSFLSAQ
ncbi:MAG: hypothetical protein A4S17_00670 [Proteobacteria bacterium HN_bin10]|nr:MAG: hypothetical protein A4S17_00670 [Proteobacteria bacterium HN_bin10]